MEEVKRMFKPEFLNRIDDIIVFSHLSKEEIRENYHKLYAKKIIAGYNALQMDGVMESLSYLDEKTFVTV